MIDDVAAARLVARLAAAFPIPRVPDATVRLYVEELARLADEQTAADAVRAVVLGDDRWPSLHRLLDEYAAAARRRALLMAETRGLPEPERVPMPEHVRAWLDARGIGRSIDPPRAHTDEELAAELARSRDERDRRQAERITPTNEAAARSRDRRRRWWRRAA